MCLTTKIKYISILLWVLLCWDSNLVFGLDASHVFTTGSVLEIDRCVSAWLIKRFVDPEAIFTFVKPGEFVTQGTAFDTADARLQRNHRQATCEVIKEYYHIRQPDIALLLKCVHDIEINAWGKQRFSESTRIERDINEMIRTSQTNQECLSNCFQYLDRFLAEHKGNN